MPQLLKYVALQRWAGSRLPASASFNPRMMLMWCLLPQFWDCLFKVTVVDCVVRLMSFTGKGIVLLTCPSQPEECFRRRAQVSCMSVHKGAAGQ